MDLKTISVLGMLRTLEGRGLLLLHIYNLAGEQTWPEESPMSRRHTHLKISCLVSLTALQAHPHGLRLFYSVFSITW
ncbi:hypothetical protein QVD17_01555 [Tagetes erecta]|uniref:Uncharacterized protein n=1 Tax=Tagetes erecta TaxID=13708 RepID=A0AAD8LAT7_TARER|nr:hypothetical protein QVD17_01555 [Tagetes erecta]